MAEWTKARHQAARARCEAFPASETVGETVENWVHFGTFCAYQLPDALDAIEAKDAEIVRLRAALAPFATYYTRHVNSGFASGIDESEIGIAYISSNDPQNPGARISLRDVHTAFDTLNGGK